MIILTVILTLTLVGGGVFGYFYLKMEYEMQIAEAQADLAEYIDIYGVLGDIWVGYTVAVDQPYGRRITAEDLIPIDVPSVNAANVITDMNDLVGKFFRINITEGTILTTDVIMDFPIKPDERAFDVITTFNPIGFKSMTS
jgi:Flp pilus assembly protein CpaB